jgi:cytochrome P450
LSRTSSFSETIDLTDPATFATDPRRFWREIRAQAPVYRHAPVDGRPGFWVVSRHADVLAAYGNPKVFSSARGTVLDVLLNGVDSAGGKMLAVSDRPRHTQLRNVMLRAFSPRVLGDVTREVDRRTVRLVESVAGTGVFDFATAVAEHIPMGTICDLLAIPGDDRAELLGWNKCAVSSDDEQHGELDSATARSEILLYFAELAERRRSDPGPDVVSMLATARIDDQPLTLEEIALNCYSIILGGDESSRMSAITAVYALAENPGQWRALRDGAVSLETAVEEVLRWATPAMHFARTATCDWEIDGQPIRKGDIVTLWNTSANNDEAVFASPETLMLNRVPNKHVTFGYGAHFCIGAFLGRAELRALLSALVRSVAGIELTGRAPTRVHSNFLFGYSSLPVSFTPANR